MKLLDRILGRQSVNQFHFHHGSSQKSILPSDSFSKPTDSSADLRIDKPFLRNLTDFQTCTDKSTASVQPSFAKELIDTSFEPSNGSTKDEKVSSSEFSLRGDLTHKEAAARDTGLNSDYVDSQTWPDIAQTVPLVPAVNAYALPKPYQVMYDVNEREGWPPINPMQHFLSEEQKLELYGCPLVDLREEKFTPNIWRKRWQILKSRSKVPDIRKSIPVKTDVGEQSTDKQVFKIGVPTLVGRGLRARRIQRYRILDTRGNEIHLYANEKLTFRNLDPFRTEVKTRYPGPTSESGTGLSEQYPTNLEELDCQLRGQMAQPRSSNLRLRFQPNRTRVKCETSETRHRDRKMNECQRLHPNQAPMAYFSACTCCDVVSYQGVHEAPLNCYESCCASFCRGIPAIDFCALFNIKASEKVVDIDE